ncbi:STAS domain-containing protein [Streptomyces sp. NPDC056500]|uniref:STAS domain-containing protein n=1 Tax=Streptomyces sp. NPDC056500 TaxID=3345840 RepID=UPI0036C4428B
MYVTQSADQRPPVVARRGRGAVILTLSGEFDLDTIAPVTAAFDQAMTGPEVVVVDLEGVSFADSTMVNLLLQAHRALGTRFRLAAPSPPVQRLIDLLGLDRVLHLHASVDEALAAGPSAPSDSD